MNTTTTNKSLGIEAALNSAIIRLETSAPALKGEQWLRSRYRRIALDLGVAAVAGVASLPVLAVAGIGIKMEDGGPIIYRDERVGMNLEHFQMLKLRSMKVNCGEGLKCEGDSRVTKIGRFIRKTSIDELPQMWNVIKGDLSVVAHRPLRAVHIAQGILNDIFSSQKEADTFLKDVYGRMRPGITGPNQVAGTRDYSADSESLAIYVQQVIDFYENASPQTDIDILRKTVGAVMGADQAY